jgi:hypothetical protein
MAAQGAELQDGDGREGRIARSWRLSRLAWQIVRSDRAILVLAITSTLLSAVALAVVYDLTGMFSAHRHRGDGHFALITLIVAFPLTFLSVFFNTAIAAAANGVLEGKRLSLRDALAVPGRRIGQVAAWSLLATVVGVIIDQIARRLPLLGNVIVRVVGLSWSLAALFVVPILATEGCAAPECLRRSVTLVKKRWGEGISGNVLITLWAVVLIVPLAFLLGIAIALSRGHGGVRVALLALLAIVFVLVMAASGVVRQTFDVVLYRYALSGTAAAGFSESDLQSPFSKGVLGVKASATPGAKRGAAQPMHRPSKASLWAWLFSAAVGAGLVVLWELHKHHWAHRVSARVIAAAFAFIFLTLAVRFVLWLIERATSSSG